MRTLLLFAILLVTASANAGSMTLSPVTVPEWKAVYGRVEARDSVPARARISGVAVELNVTEGETVYAGEQIAMVRDDKIDFQVDALDAQLRALQAQLEAANSDFERGQALVQKGVITIQRLDQLSTQVDVIRNQMAATAAQKSVVVQQRAEGVVLAPVDGRVLKVPVTRGAVLMVGETVAVIGGGGFFLRLAIPERHAATLVQGAPIRIMAEESQSEGRLAKIYPQIENGRVIADVEVDTLQTTFVDARVLVKLPIAERHALLVPREAIETRFGVDFVTVSVSGGHAERAVVIGEVFERADGEFVEVMSGLAAGDVIVVP